MRIIVLNTIIHPKRSQIGCTAMYFHHIIIPKLIQSATMTVGEHYLQGNLIVMQSIFDLTRWVHGKHYTSPVDHLNGEFSFLKSYVFDIRRPRQNKVILIHSPK